MISLSSRPFPLKIEKRQVEPAAPAEDPTKKKLLELVHMVHGSFESKQKIIDDFNAEHADCSKKSIERFLKECFVKDKKEQDFKPRWYTFFD